ncbi:MAG: MotA/TolQ/ExbB proton channel family protein [Gammaproteobacteria bacterium]|nr:MAG: MotA/TolQ/ExbB proton channel family protein [Gammaproteobacteria bacterium]
MNSPYGISSIWLQGDAIIKTVAIILMLMSISSWFVIVLRTWGLLRLRSANHALSDFWHAQSFAEGLHVLGTDRNENPYRHLAEEGQSALDHHQNHKTDLHGNLPLADWLTACLKDSIDHSTDKLQRGLALLASVGSTAPFVGLFGTVWGIYHALVSIGLNGSASIDKIAGPVGEALIMTAFGLIVAIPAVLGYNALNRGNRTITSKLNRFAHQLHAYFLTGAPPASSKGSNHVILKNIPRKNAQSE